MEGRGLKRVLSGQFYDPKAESAKHGLKVFWGAGRKHIFPEVGGAETETQLFFLTYKP